MNLHTLHCTVPTLAHFTTIPHHWSSRFSFPLLQSFTIHVRCFRIFRIPRPRPRLCTQLLTAPKPNLWGAASDTRVLSHGTRHSPNPLLPAQLLKVEACSRCSLGNVLRAQQRTTRSQGTGVESRRRNTSAQHARSTHCRCTHKVVHPRKLLHQRVGTTGNKRRE